MTIAGPRPVVPLMRSVLGGGAVFVFLAGFDLFVFAESTDRLFAWTIASPLTAGFVGTFYLMACAIAATSARATAWHRARVGVPGVWVFVVLTLAATLMHLGQFHLDGSGFARIAAWIWLAVYASQPVALTVAWWRQRRVPGVDPMPARPMARGLAAISAAQGIVLVLYGTLLFLAPTSTAWPWALTPLTGRAIAAWLVGLGLVALTTAREADLERVRPAMLGFLALGLLQAPLVLRFGDEVDWSGGGSAYAAAAVLVAATGAAGILANRRASSD